jgi:hypothetical protein
MPTAVPDIIQVDEGVRTKIVGKCRGMYMGAFLRHVGREKICYLPHWERVGSK